MNHWKVGGVKWRWVTQNGSICWRYVHFTPCISHTADPQRPSEIISVWLWCCFDLSPVSPGPVGVVILTDKASKIYVNLSWQIIMNPTLINTILISQVRCPYRIVSQAKIKIPKGWALKKNFWNSVSSVRCCWYNRTPCSWKIDHHSPCLAIDWGLKPWSSTWV